MSEPLPEFKIVIPIYEQVNLLDVASACEMFYWMGQYWGKRKVTIDLVEAKGRVVTTLAGPRLTPDHSFDNYRQHGIQAQLIWVPGAGSGTIEKMMADADYIRFLREQAARAEYVTSVCEGALLLANAGLLDGYKATTHWAVVPCLRKFEKVKVAECYPRFVVDRNRVTGGGISSGLDESLEIIRIICGQATAEKVQVVTQYFPQPPVMGRIETTWDCDISIPPRPAVE
jgi:transcriptional regulator GlxA family with amidase domain